MKTPRKRHVARIGVVQVDREEESGGDGLATLDAGVAWGDRVASMEEDWRRWATAKPLLPRGSSGG